MQIFHPSTNTISRVTLFGAAFLVAGGLWLLQELDRSRFVTRASEPREQPIPFSHQHHVGDIGIDCRYCHTSVEDSAFAGIPPTRTCMNCHSQLYADSPTLEPVRASFRDGTSIRWNRVHDLPDFVYFDHSIHVHKGMACVTCHGRVDRMALVRKQNSLKMEWCLDCHRHPQRYVRPREAVFLSEWTPPEDDPDWSAKLVAEYDIKPRTSCSTCHR